MAVSKKKIIGVSLIVLVGLGGLSSLVSGPSRTDEATGGRENSTTSPSAATPTETVPSAVPSVSASAESESPAEVLPVSEEDLALASSSTVPLTAVAGRYVVVEGYKYFNTLTVLEFDTGEVAYFATDMGHPFGSINSGMAIAADQASRDLTGFGESVPVDGPAGIDAARMLSDLRDTLG